MISELMKITNALSDTGRVRILLALKNNELCVCQIVELLGLAPSTVSKHIFLLKNAGLVESRKEGLWIHYSLPAKKSLIVRNALGLVFCSLKSDKTLTKDKRKLSKILSLNLDKLCRKHRRESENKHKKKD